VALAFGQPERDCPPASVSDCGQLGIDAALGATDRLGGLTAARVRSVLIQLDVRTMDIPELTRGSCRHKRQDPREKFISTPSTKPGVHRAPGSKLPWQVAPRDTRAQDKENRRNHEPVVFRRMFPHRPPAGFAPRAVNFLRRCHNGTGSSLRRTSFMRTLGIVLSILVPSAVAGFKRLFPTMNLANFADCIFALVFA
jgi:hypothetical protein